MLNSTHIPLNDLNYLDQISFKLPHILYSSNVSPKLVSGSVIIGLSLMCVTIGSYFTINKPKNAHNPNDDIGSLWDPTDNDNSAYIKTCVDLDVLNNDVINIKTALMMPISGAATLYILNYCLNNLNKDKLNFWLNWYVLFMSIISNSIILDYSITCITRKLGYLFGKNSSFFFTRYRITLSTDKDNYPLGLLQNFNASTFKNDEKIKKYKSYLKRNKIIFLKPTDVIVNNQLYNIIFDLKFLVIYPLSITISFLFYKYNAILNDSYTFEMTNWLILNLISINFAIFGIKQTKPSSFKVGFLLLVCLFFYDIYFVFRTEIMVNVATGLDIPIKLLIPRKPESNNYWEIPMSILGLGDIVIPGSIIALCLRFDLYNYHQQPNSFHHLLKYNKPYFYVSIFSYFIGLVLTIISLEIYRVGQPALLYIVPCLLTGVTGLSVIRSEFKNLWNYNEDIKSFNASVDAEDDPTDEDDDYPSTNINNSHNVSEEKHEPTHREVETDLDVHNNDLIIYEFGNTDDEDDDTFIIQSESESEDEFLDDDIMDNEIELLQKDVNHEAKELYSNEEN